MRFFAISTARREYYCYCRFNQKIFKRPSTRRIRNFMSIHAEEPTNEVKKIRIFLAAYKSNYELVNSDSVSNDNVIKTVPSQN